MVRDVQIVFILMSLLKLNKILFKFKEWQKEGKKTGEN